MDPLSTGQNVSQGMKRSLNREAPYYHNPLHHIRLPLNHSVCLVQDSEFPKEIFFMLIELLGNWKHLSSVCKFWNHLVNEYHFEWYNQKKPISIRHFDLFNLYGRQLKYLNLQNCNKLQDIELSRLIVGCPNLQHALINSEFITNKAFKETLSLTSLKSLSLNCNQLTHTIFKILPKCSTFQTLTINTHKMKSLIHLPKLTNLTALNMTLSVSYCKDFHPITELTSLKALELLLERHIPNRKKLDLEVDLAVSKTYLAAITNLGGLRTLSLRCKDHELTEESLTNYLLPLTSLKSLKLQGFINKYYHTRDVGFDLSILSKLTTLNMLSLKRFKFCEKVDHLVNIGRLTFLKELELSEFYMGGDVNLLAKYLMPLTALKVLRLKGVNIFYRQLDDNSDLSDLSKLPLEKIELIEHKSRFQFTI